MFLDVTLRRNPALIEAAFKLHQEGVIQPDTYILDLDAIISNAKAIKYEADKYGIKLYFMTKQFGRNPYVSRKLMDLGYEGAVAVDYREADILYDSGIKIGHVGHLVQVPSNKIESMLLKRPEVITVYSVEKAKEISDIAAKLGINQNIMLRVIDKDDTFYPGQYGGFYIDELVEKAGEIIKLPNVNIYGITSFPCFLYDSDSQSIKETNNIKTILKAKEVLEKNFKIILKEINTPSATCTSNIRRIAELGGTHGEPGHGLVGTTPIHAVKDEVEIPAIVYVSEVSHNLGNASYCYGGGHYRRSHMHSALVGKGMESMKRVEVEMPDSNSIDYYICLKENANIGETVILSFRTQIFVTRSEVAVVKGISSGRVEIAGIYDSLGRLIRR
ncbi:YhfX family PLP-dependent enzyme [Fonticella tunisiensis]|uniref:Putative amino acid racemase n=1 Tax=Fonticella tunisiensis TaxID=1096341 RepID=A0A4R7KRS4_9CLOT|nr:YhfX family PLP-dependent enzyme [Fonticella tunisiensis]TDT61323.1 putative amino acid racemase [Fonticella tunisiensis]